MFVTLTQAVVQNLNISELGLTPLHLMIVMAVYTHPNITMSKLAQVLDISSAQLSRTMRTVEEKGLVKREHNQDNRRIVNVHRTKVGDEFAEAQMKRVQARLADRLSSLTSEQRADLNQHLAASIAILGEAGIVQMSPEEFLQTMPNHPEFKA